MTPPASSSSSHKKLDDGDDTLSIASTPSSSAHGSSSAHASTSAQASKKFTIPDTWRPSVMVAINAPTEAEKRKLLSTNMRSAITRDLMTTMYTFMPKPNKDFCTEVANKLVAQYSFMRDAGTNVSGYVSII